MPDFRFLLRELHELYAILKIDEIRVRPTTLTQVFSPTSKPSAVWLFAVDENLICILQSKDLCMLITVPKTTWKRFWVLNISSFLWSDMCSSRLHNNNAKQQFFFRSVSAKHDRVLFDRILLIKKSHWVGVIVGIYPLPIRIQLANAKVEVRVAHLVAYLIPSNEVYVCNDRVCQYAKGLLISLSS